MVRVADRVPAVDIEQIVGAPRHEWVHFGRADSLQGRFFLLHSRRCVATNSDLRECPFSQALDRGIYPGPADLDRTVPVGIRYGNLTIEAPASGRQPT